MSPLGGYSIVLAPSSRVFHRSRYTEAEDRMTLCGKSVTCWWQSTTEYQGLLQFLRRHCYVCFPPGREDAMRGLQVAADG